MALMERDQAYSAVVIHKEGEPWFQLLCSCEEVRWVLQEVIQTSHKVGDTDGSGNLLIYCEGDPIDILNGIEPLVDRVLIQ